MRARRTTRSAAPAVASAIAALGLTLALPAVATAEPHGLGAASMAAPLASPRATSSSLDPYGSQGMNVIKAHNNYTAGDHRVVVAYVEGGINWHNGDATTLANAVYVNWHELPVPCHAASAAGCTTTYASAAHAYDTNGDGAVTAADWASDPRVTDANHNSVLDPEDLIAAFSGSSFSPPTVEPAGFPKAISGWDFYDTQHSRFGQNDPATVDASYGHSDGQMSVIHSICPKCLILPVKAGDEALDSSEALAKAWLFAYQSGARVIVSVTADLGYSSFARKVLRYLDSKGVIVVESSNDFDSTDHQGGMFWGNVLPGNGLVANTSGVPSGPTLTKMPGPYWSRSDLTSWGVHNMFSVATYGGSTSESTPTLGAVLALVLSEGLKAHVPLTGPQAVQVLREASSQLPHLSTLPWSAPAGEWNPQYGYGMPNVLTAMKDVVAKAVPAAPEITSPRWYSLEDPSRGGSVSVTGTVTAEAGQAYSWKLQYGLGQDPGKWTTLAHGSAPHSWAGTFGTLALSKVPKAFWSGKFAFSRNKSLSTADRYDVSFRVVTTSTQGSRTLHGEARRVVAAFHDASAVARFPKQVGPSGEGQPALVDLQGTGRLDIVFATSDGTVEALDPSTGHELPGWPVHTLPIGWPAPLPGGIKAGHEPISGDVAVGDLDHTGSLSVVVSSIDGRVYVFNAHGHLVHGWPRRMARGATAPPIPRPSMPNVRLGAVGALAPPVLVALGGPGQLDIVQAGWDGWLHAWLPNGTPVSGWPVKVALPAKSVKLPAGYTLEKDQKLDTPPAVAVLSTGGKPSLVIRSQYTEISNASLQPLPYSFVFAYSAGGKLLTGWPVRLQGTIEDYGSAQEFITEGTTAPAAASVLGHGIDQIAVGPIWSPESLLLGSGKVAGSYGSASAVLGALVGVQVGPASAIFGPLPGPTPTPFTGSGSFGLFGGRVAFAEPELGSESFAAALLYSGSGNPIDEVTSVWRATAGATTVGGGQMKGFPTSEQGQDFLGSPMFAPVTSSGGNSVVIGGDSSAVSARMPSGGEAPSFPKFTGGWTVYAPSAGDLFGGGHDDLVTVTREGWMFAWKTYGPAPVAGAWWRAFHDEWNSGRLETDSRPPGVVRSAILAPGGRLSFIAPGAHWYDGTPVRYNVRLGASRLWRHYVVAGAAGTKVHFDVPAGTTSLVIQAANADGLVGGQITVTASA